MIKLLLPALLIVFAVCAAYGWLWWRSYTSRDRLHQRIRETIAAAQKEANAARKEIDRLEGGGTLLQDWEYLDQLYLQEVRALGVRDEAKEQLRKLQESDREERIRELEQRN